MKRLPFSRSSAKWSCDGVARAKRYEEGGKREENMGLVTDSFGPPFSRLGWDVDRVEWEDKLGGFVVGEEGANSWKR